MSGEYTGFFKSSDGHTISVIVFAGDGTIRVAKFRGQELITIVELNGEEATQLHHAKPTEAGKAWYVAKNLTIAPADVDRFGDALHKALMRC